MLKATIFREYDIRGVAESELRSADVELLGRALGTYLIRKAGKRVSLGRDCRLSSDGCATRCARARGVGASGGHRRCPHPATLLLQVSISTWTAA